MKRPLNILGKIALWFLAAIGATTVIVIALNWNIFMTGITVYDRLYLRPCYYYPNAFIDCEPSKEG